MIEEGQLTDRELLIAARALLATQDRWWRGVKHERESIRAPLDPICHCPITAIAEVSGGGMTEVRLLVLFFRAVGLGDIPQIATWNDDPLRTHPEVLAGFDGAIANASNEPAA